MDARTTVIIRGFGGEANHLYLLAVILLRIIMQHITNGWVDLDLLVLPSG